MGPKDQEKSGVLYLGKGSGEYEEIRERESLPDITAPNSAPEMRYALIMEGRKIAEISDLPKGQAGSIVVGGWKNSDVPMITAWFESHGYSIDLPYMSESFLPKHMRCHSRKRFVKLLMGRGYSRNIANRIAKNIRDIQQRMQVPEDKAQFTYRRQWFRRVSAFIFVAPITGQGNRD